MSATGIPDVIVVGAGSAGCLMAARLAQSGSRSVLLVEAGPDLRASPPARMHDGWGTYRETGWGFEAEPTGPRQAEPLYRGRVVGGTSWVTRFALRGAPADYDLWAGLGNPGWDFAGVLPYFVKLEHDLDFAEEPWHGRDGPIPITRYPQVEPSPYELAVSEALAASGFPSIEDHNRPGAVGVGRMPRNSRDGVRATGVDAYLPPGATPSNLRVRADAEVAAVYLEGTRAAGVRLVDGSAIEADWVVLCAGCYGTPMILMRSGIGPADHLREVNVSPRVDLPGVGENLADHPGFDVNPGYRGPNEVGPRIFSLATFHSSAADPRAAPDLALWLHDPWGGPGEPAETGIGAILLTPRSRGRIRLRSDDPSAPPRITLPELDDGSDVDRLVEGSIRAWEIAQHPAVRRLCALPATARPTAPAGLREAIRRGIESYPHTVGTAAMGPRPEDGAVVGVAGDVHGVEQLTVADASVIPTAPSGFPHLITMMIAERIAEGLDRRI